MPRSGLLPGYGSWPTPIVQARHQPAVSFDPLADPKRPKRLPVVGVGAADGRLTGLLLDEGHRVCARPLIVLGGRGDRHWRNILQAFGDDIEAAVRRQSCSRLLPEQTDP